MDRHAEARDRKVRSRRRMAVNGRSVFTMDRAERSRTQPPKDRKKTRP